MLARTLFWCIIRVHLKKSILLVIVKNRGGARPQQDFKVESFDDIVGPEIADPENGVFPKGASNVTNPNNSTLSGQYHSIPQGTELPFGLDIIADGSDLYRNSPHAQGHYTVFPTREMTVSEFNDLYKSFPWVHRGKKK